MEEMVVSCVIKHLNLVDALQSLINFQYQEEHAEEYDLLCKIMGLYAAAKSLQSCPTLCDPIDGSPLGKNTGVGCHFLLQCMKVKSESEAAESCPTLSDPMDCGPPGSSIHGIFQARVLEWGALHGYVPLIINIYLLS